MQLWMWKGTLTYHEMVDFFLEFEFEVVYEMEL
jgi:hypothetical protein